MSGRRKRPLKEIIESDDGNHNKSQKAKRIRRNHNKIDKTSMNVDVSDENDRNDNKAKDNGEFCSFGCGRAKDPSSAFSGGCCKSCADRSGQHGLCSEHDLDCRIRQTPRDSISKPDSNGIYKVGINEKVEYGDGGGSKMIWDIYVCDKLQTINAETVANLKKDLIELGLENDDWRDGEPIMNIIDPDLFVYKYYEKNEQYWLSDTHKKDIEGLKQDFVDRVNEGFLIHPVRDKDYIEQNHPKYIWKRLKENDEKGYFIRRKYQWLATQFMQKDDGNIEIISSIHNISPRNKYENLYRGIEHVFEKMLPLFNKFPIFKNRESKEFQVIVKSQRYEIDDMSGYSGHWHQEGLTENIVLAGIYYYEVNDGLNGGNLRFKNINGPSKVYHEWATPDFTNDDGDVDEQNYDKQWAAKWDLKGRIDFVHEAKITEGTAIVFDNVNLVHRVRMLRNKMKDGNKRYRSFLAFFIVDPEKEIKSTKNISTLRKQDYIDILMENTMIISRDIAILICDYCRCGYTLNEAKEIRKLNIEVRKKPDLKGKFACYRFGNSGDQIWFKDGKIHPYLDYDRYGDMDRDNFEWVSSTVSEF